MVEELLNKYDLYHSSIISGGKIKFNINYLPDGSVYISLVALIKDEEMKATMDALDNDELMNYYLPKILERFFSKNVKINIRKIMGNSNQGTIIIQRQDLKDSLIIRNCSVKVMELVKLLSKCFTYISNNKKDSMLIFDEEYRQYDNYIKYNVLFDYAKYKNDLYNNADDINQDDLLILNIARYGYTFEELEVEDIWEEVKKSFADNSKVIEICDAFKSNDFKENNTYTKALVLAEFEKNNDMLIQSNGLIVEEAEAACKNNVNLFDNSYVEYFENKAKEYEKTANEEMQAICIDFVDSHNLNKKADVVLSTNTYKKNNNGKLLIDKIKEIKNGKNSFSSIINDPIKEEDLVEEEVEDILSSLDKNQIKMDADEQARIIIQLERERDELRRAADEYARIILKNQKEYRAIEESTKMRELKIMELEQQNMELQKMAEENARYIFEQEKLYQDEAELRKEVDDSPVKSQDIDKLNNLLYAISTVKNLDFSVNHPTTMQTLTLLEEKTITYLTTHKNIVHEESVMMPIDKEEMLETKPVIELLSMIRNAYTSSHNFEKDGRHTLINFTPVDEDTFRVSLSSIKEDEEDLLMDAFFEQYQLTDNVIEELCKIYKDGAVIVASKTDNIPPDKADYLAIDNMNNAIRFMDCSRAIIEKVKEYI